MPPRAGLGIFGFSFRKFFRNQFEKVRSGLWKVPDIGVLLPGYTILYPALFAWRKAQDLVSFGLLCLLRMVLQLKSSDF